MFKKIEFAVKCAVAFVGVLGFFLAGAIGNLRGLMVKS